MIELEREDGYVDATEMCQQKGKRISDYMALKSTQKYLQYVSQKLGIPIDVLVEQGGKGKGSRTWVHRVVGLSIAQWLGDENRGDANIWISERIDNLQGLLQSQEAKVKELESKEHRESVKTVMKEVASKPPLQEAMVFALKNDEFGMMDELGTQRLKDTIEIQRYERQIEALETFLMCEYDLPSGEVERIKNGERTANIDKMFRRATRKR